ncbi:MAG: DNA polymerase III subunit alpha [Rhizobiales bacterium]|nr:DNA polymerase III subunit alpha [Hyphomicrobiales bacterium]MBI3674482.1 DNA polymerase III subunit alpha [Hyphomicrobiales bacterium]
MASDSTGPTFIHLRIHSAYSLSEGALPIKQMAMLAKDAKMPALAITDTGNLFGALEFSEAMAEKGIQPIVGCTLKVDLAPPQAPDALRSPQHGLRRLPSLALLAKDEAGYLNLMALSSRAYLDSPDTAEPHVPLALLEAHHQGLICLTGGPAGPVNEALVQGQTGLARAHLETLSRIFGNRLYVELQRHGLEAERNAEPGLVDLAYALDIPLVASNEAYFPSPDDFVAHDALICIAEGEVLATEDRRRLTPEHYFKPQAAMAALFADLPEAVENTVEIARRCAFRVKSRTPILPRFSQSDEGEELRRQAHEGLAARLATRGAVAGRTPEDYLKRLDFELDIIVKMQFPGYFLIVSDFIKYAKGQGIPVGPGRGSGAGSMVAYALTITDLDPFRFNLLFERFLNPERVSMPDFDIDFCQDRRDEVIAYVQKRHGADRVAQIITFGKLQARMVTRDVGRVLQMPYGQVDRLSKLIPNNPANYIPLKDAIEAEPRLREERDRDPLVKTLFDIALKLEGLNRNASTHAAGIVIGDRPLEQLVPLYRDPRSALPATQYNMKYVEKAGLVKFDFLGLKTLTVIDKAQKLIRLREPAFDIDRIPYDDSKTYEMLGHGDTVGVFQLESSGMRDVLKKMRADCIEDIIAIVALYRPGPMDNIPRFIACKKGEEHPDYLHPLLEPILKETYGIMVYQEQVMQIAQVLSGYSLGEADLLRRAMGKKIKSEMDAQKERFVKGAVEKGIAARRADFIFELVAKFAGYGFNKSHAAAYAVVAYQTAYLKANHPVEFLAASMSLDLGNTDKLMAFRQEAQRLGVKIVPPSVNASAVDFAVKDGAVVYALAALRNVGAGAMQALVAAREEAGPFTSLGNFARRLDPKSLNKRALESLAKAGAFDGLNPNRAQVLDAVELIISVANRTTSEAAAGQNDLFGGTQSSSDELVLPRRDAWLPMERLAEEFEAVGFYLSGHPLDDYVKPLAKLGVETWASFHDKALTKGATAAKLAGTVTHRQERRSKSGNKFAFVGFSDPTGQFEAICFSDTLAVARDLLEPGKAVIARVEADVESEEVKLRLQGVEILDKAAAAMIAGLTIFVRDAKPIESIAQRLVNGGRSPVRLVFLMDKGREIELALGNKFTVTPQIKGAIKAIVGVVDVQDF